MMKELRKGELSVMNYVEAVEKYADTVARICISNTRSYADAEDCWQETFMKLYTKPPRTDDEIGLKSWLIRVAINECRDFARRRRLRDTVDLDDITELADDDASEHDIDLVAAVAGLPEMQRLCIQLVYYEGYTTSECAHLLKCPENTVKSRLKRGREKLKTLLTESKGEEE